MKIALAKPTHSVIGETDPRNIIFSSDYGTLKYYATGTFSIYIDGDLCGNLESVGWNTVNHNLGYYPFIEIYVGNPIGSYEYCPTKSGGASTYWDIDYIITTTYFRVYVSIGGFGTQPTFYFKYFIYKNDLDLW